MAKNQASAAHTAQDTAPASIQTDKNAAGEMVPKWCQEPECSIHHPMNDAATRVLRVAMGRFDEIRKAKRVGGEKPESSKRAEGGYSRCFAALYTDCAFLKTVSEAPVGFSVIARGLSSAERDGVAYVVAPGVTAERVSTTADEDIRRLLGLLVKA